MRPDLIPFVVGNKYADVADLLLNPLRAKLVKSLSQLDRYRWSGHSVLVAKIKHDWQDRDYVLKWFGKTEADAVKAYREHVNKGIDQGRRPELVAAD